MDTHREELLAMFDSFLDQGYDPQVFERVAGLQSALHHHQAALLGYLENGALEPGKYVDDFNSVLQFIFSQCENALGKEDFQRVFGTSLAEVGGLIDKEEFIRQHELERSAIAR